MQITTEQAFKVGFLYNCAERGLTVQETHQLVKRAIAEIKQGGNIIGMEKRAFIPAILGGAAALGGGALSLGGKLLSVAPGVMSAGVMGALGIPVAAGAGTGYLAAKLTSDNTRDSLEDAKHEEITSEYERLADEAKRRALLKRIQKQTGRRIVPMSPSLGA